MQTLVRTVITAGLYLAGSQLIGLSDANAQQDQPLSTAAKIEAAMFGKHRSDDNIGRNQYRHPVGTLTTLQMDDSMTVMEMWPGGGWYTEVLAPVLRDNGKLVVASYDPDIPDQPDYRYRLHEQLLEKFAATPDVYDKVDVVNYSSPEQQSLGQPGQMDMVLTFRSMHGWVADEIADDVMADMFAVLKPGGMLGVVQHRAAAGADPAVSVPNGYVPEKTIIELAVAAGFNPILRSEVNANAADDHDHPEGVWTLPPSLQLGEQDQQSWLAIGESDRMTLLFKKPAE